MLVESELRLSMFESTFLSAAFSSASVALFAAGVGAGVLGVVCSGCAGLIDVAGGVVVLVSMLVEVVLLQPAASKAMAPTARNIFFIIFLR